MALDLTKVQFLYSQAEEKKSEIKEIYNKVLEFTDPFLVINDAGKTKIGDRREIDSVAVDSIDALTSFIMSSILTRTGKWCDAEIDEAKLRELEGESIEGQIAEAKPILQKATDTTFRYIQGSNYYNEVAKAVASFVRVGTGVYSVRETGSTNKPFIYSYVGLDNLYILEDTLGRPNIIFKLHPEVNAEYIQDLFGSDCQIPSEVDPADPSLVTDVYEIQIPEYDETQATTVYNYIVTNKDFTTTLKEIQLSYPTMIAFRWGLIEGSPWGKSPVLQNIGILEELEEYKDLYKSQARKIANPALAFYGNEELFYALSMEESTINYLGDPNKQDQPSSLQTLTTGSNLMPLDKLIEEHRGLFRQALMVDNLVMSNQDGKGTTAEYTRYMAEMFRKRFANTYELVNSELLEPTFMGPFSILLKYEMLELTEDIIPFITIKYVNQLSKALDQSYVNELLIYAQTVAQLNQAAQLGVYIDMIKTIPYIAEKLGIPMELIPNEEQLTELQEAKIRQAQEQTQIEHVGGSSATDIQGI